MSEIDLPPSTDSGSVGVDTRVVTAVADAREVEPIDLAPLYGAIDPDALDRLVRSQPIEARPIEISFRFAGCDVVVDGFGRVTATPTADDESERGA